MSDTLINITACYLPADGSAKHRSRLSAIDAAEWLELAVDHWRARYGLPVAVSISGFPGLVMTGGGRERDAYYRVAQKAVLLHVPVNPSHQLGAALTLKMGFEYAHHAGFTYLVNAAEDLLPRPGSVEAKLRAVREGYDFVGGVGNLDLPNMPPDQHRWIRQDSRPYIGAGCQLFACRAEPFALGWDAGQVYDCIEIFMGNFIRGLKWLSLAEEYDHTHSYSDWLKWKAALEEKIGLCTMTKPG